MAVGGCQQSPPQWYGRHFRWGRRVRVRGTLRRAPGRSWALLGVLGCPQALLVRSWLFLVRYRFPYIHFYCFSLGFAMIFDIRHCFLCFGSILSFILSFVLALTLLPYLKSSSPATPHSPQHHRGGRDPPPQNIQTIPSGGVPPQPPSIYIYIYIYKDIYIYIYIYI